MTQADPAELDALFLRCTQERMTQALRSAHCEISIFIKEIKSLVTEPELPLAYRRAYGNMVTQMSVIEGAIAALKTAIKRNTDYSLESRPARSRKSRDTPVDSDLIRVVQETIEQINSAEKHLVCQLEAVRNTILQRHGDPSDLNQPHEWEFDILFDTGPARRCYQTCGLDGDPLRIDVGLYMPEMNLGDDWNYSWNIFEGKIDHPLQKGHHFYLVHCLLDHMGIPWHFLAYIKDINVQISFSDYQTVWERPSNDVL